MSQAIIFSTKLTILVSHLNYGNHLGADSMLSIFQEARVRWLKSLDVNMTEGNIENGIGWIMKDAHIDYQSEGHFDDKLTIDLSIADTTKASLNLSTQIYNDTANQMLCQGTTRLVFFDYQSSKVARIPAILLDL